MSEMTFYDQKGEPVAYMEDEEIIYNYMGKPLAYLVDDSIYSFSGKHLGRLQEGWIRDQYGNCVLFTLDAVNGPTKPSVHAMPPRKEMKGMIPRKEPPERPWLPIKKTTSWSKLANLQFFDVKE